MLAKLSKTLIDSGSEEVTVGEGVASPVSASEPDVRLSPHPAPLPTSLCERHQLAYTSWLETSSISAIAISLMSTAQSVE